MGEKAADVENILDGREERFSLQKELLAQYCCPVVSATVNYPGPVKNDAVAGIIFKEMVSAIRQLPLENITMGVNGAGAYLMATTKVSAIEIKKQAMEIEKNHKLGRLFDIDVIDYPYRKISRADIDNEARPCIICNDDFRVCIRAGRHTVEALRDKICLITEVYLLERNRKKTGGTDQ